MNWSNESWVKLYTRDTVDWAALPWEARALFLFLLRKVDRAGVLTLGRHGEIGLARHVGMPEDVVKIALSALIDDGCVTRCNASSHDVLIVTNFAEAQTALSSNKQRQSEWRARARDLKQAESLNTGNAALRDVTRRNAESRDVTNRIDRIDRIDKTLPDSAAPARVALELVPFEPPVKLDFASAYAAFPRKEGKSKGMEICVRTIRTPMQLAQLKQAIINYAQLVSGREKKHVKQFDSFMAVWRDYVDEQVVQDGQGLAAGSSSPVGTYADPRDIGRLDELEEDYERRGVPIPWRNDPRRWAMKQDVLGRPVKPMGPVGNVQSR